MRHYDLSTERVLPIAFIAVALLAFVGGTFRIQHQKFGRTPFFASVNLAAQEQVDFIRYSVESGFTYNPPGVLAALFGGTSPSTAATTTTTSGVPVITYHRIVEKPDGDHVTIEQFKEQMYALKRAGWQTVTLADFEAFVRGDRKLPEKSFLITFDDGAKESFYPVDPLFRTLGYNGVAYIIVDGMNTAGSTYYLSPEEITRMLETGRWEIGSHSKNGHQTHNIDATGEHGHFFSDKLWLPEYDRIENEDEFRARVARDLNESKEELEATFGVPVRTFAFPFGDSGEESQNFKNSSDVVIEEARKVYTIGFLQTRREEYSFNKPDQRFLAFRIEPQAEWSGADLVAVLESGSPKKTPFRARFTPLEGWIPSWGGMSLSGGVLTLGSIPESSSGSAILDGTFDWDNYTLTARTSWESGSALLLFDVINSRTYRACSFSLGHVEIQSITPEVRRIILKKAVPGLTPGNDRKLGVATSGRNVSCRVGDVAVGTATIADERGGIGLQVWNPHLGEAHLTISSLEVTE